MLLFDMDFNGKSERFKYLQSFKEVIQWFVLVFIFIIVGLIFNLKRIQFFWLLHIFFITYLYTKPLSLFSITIGPLRRVPYLKALIIAYVWAATTWILPIIENEQVSILYLISALLERFLFYFSIIIIFDLRDIRIDIREGLITFSNRLSISMLKNLALSVLITSTFLAYILYPVHISYLIGSTNIVFLFLVLLSHPKRSELFFMDV